MNRIVNVSVFSVVALCAAFLLGTAMAEAQKGGPTTIGKTKFHDILVPVFDGYTVRSDRRTPPVYPRDLRSAGVTGEATILVFIDEKGKFVDCGLLKASEPEFGTSALAVARKWHYYPLELEPGKPIMHALRFTITFSLGS